MLTLNHCEALEFTPVFSGAVFAIYEGIAIFALSCTRAGRNRFSLKLCETLEFTSIIIGSVFV